MSDEVLSNSNGGGLVANGSQGSVWIIPRTSWEKGGGLTRLGCLEEIPHVKFWGKGIKDSWAFVCGLWVWEHKSSPQAFLGFSPLKSLFILYVYRERKRKRKRKRKKKRKRRRKEGRGVREKQGRLASGSPPHAKQNTNLTVSQAGNSAEAGVCTMGLWAWLGYPSS